MRRVGVDVAQTHVGRRTGEPIDQLIEAVAGLGIGCFRINARADMGQRDRQHGLANMVEEEHPVVKRERQVGNASIVGRDVGKILGVSHGVI